MKLFTKVMAAALLSTAISGAVMAAAVDLNSDGTVADAASLKDVRAILGIAKGTGLEHEITFDEKFVAAFKAMPADPARFTDNGGQVKNLMIGMKALYADLEAAAGDDTKLKAKLGAGLLKQKFNLDTSVAGAKWDDPSNEAALKALRDAVADNPFAAVDKEPEVGLLARIKGKPSETKATDGSTVYDTFAKAEAALEAARKSKDRTAGEAVIAELKKMKVGGKYTLAQVAAYEDKADWTTTEVRAVKKAVAATAKTPADEVAIHFFKALQTAISSGVFNALDSLPEAKGLDLEDPTTFAASTGAADKLLALIIAGGKGFTSLTLENSALKASGTAHKPDPTHSDPTIKRTPSGRDLRAVQIESQIRSKMGLAAHDLVEVNPDTGMARIGGASGGWVPAADLLK